MKKLLYIFLFAFAFNSYSQLSTITQPPFRVVLKSQLQTYLTSFTDGALIFCDEDAQWYYKKSGIIQTAESGFYGELSMVNNATQTVITSTSNYTKILGTTVQGAVHNFTTVGNNRLKATATVSKTYVIDVSATVQCPTAVNQEIFISIFKNGTIIPSSEKSFTNFLNSQVQVISTGCVISLTQNDYIEVFIKNSTGLNALLIKSLTLKIN